MIHVVLPIVFSISAFILWSIIHKKCSLSLFPFPVITKLRKIFLDLKLFDAFAKREELEKNAEELEIIRDEIERHQSIMNLSLIIESSFFQFWFQTIYLLPSLIVAILDITGPNEITDLFNFRILSILISFFTYAWASFVIRYLILNYHLSCNTVFLYLRNGDKKGAIDQKNLIILVSKIIMDSLSRILLFSAWMYTSNNGQFSTWRVVVAYYMTFVFLMVFNVLFNQKDDFRSIRYLTGKFKRKDSLQITRDD